MLNDQVELIITELSLALKGPFTVQAQHEGQNPGCLSWVVSRRLGKSYIKSVPTSEFGATTDVRQLPGHEHMVATVLRLSAEAV